MNRLADPHDPHARPLHSPHLAQRYYAAADLPQHVLSVAQTMNDTLERTRANMAAREALMLSKVQ